jgi:hypothetical protein
MQELIYPKCRPFNSPERIGLLQYIMYVMDVDTAPSIMIASRNIIIDERGRCPFNSAGRIGSLMYIIPYVWCGICTMWEYTHQFAASLHTHTLQLYRKSAANWTPTIETCNANVCHNVKVLLSLSTGKAVSGR